MRRFNLGATAGVVAVALILLLAACGSSSSKSSSSSSGGAAATSSTAAPSTSAAGGSSTSAASASKAPIKVLAVDDLSGPAKIDGLAHTAGLQAAAAYYNAHGGIEGHKVVVQKVDDQSSPTTAVSVLLKALSSGTPDMIDAGTTSNDAGPLIPVLAKKNVFAMALNDGNYQCKTGATTGCPNEYTLSDGPLPAQQTVANWLKSKGVKKVGILEEEETFSQAETPVFIKALNSVGIAHTIATVNPTAVDLTPAMSELKSAGAQAVYGEVFLAPSGYTLAARAKLSWKVPVVFDLAGSSLDLTKLAPVAEVKDQVYEDIFAEMNPQDRSPGIPALLKYAKPFDSDTTVPLDVYSTGWDQLVALNDAVKVDGGNLSVKALDAAMLKIPETDPLRTFNAKLHYTTDNHENVAGSTADYDVVPAGPIVNGQVHSY